MNTSERRLALAVLVVAAALANPIFGWNENRTTSLLRALVHGRLTVDPDAATTGDLAWVARPSPAAAAALGIPLTAGEARRGHFYAGGPPGTAFVLLPFFAVARLVLPASLLDWALVVVGAAIPLAFGAVAVRRSLLALDLATEARATEAALVHALATLALPYGTRLFAHGLVIGAFAGAIACLVSRTRPRPALAGLLVAIAVTCDYSAALPAAVIGLVALARGPGALARFAAGTLPPAIVLGAYHTAAFGSPFSTPFAHYADTTTRDLYAAGVLGFSAPRPRILAEVVLGWRSGMLCTEPAALLGLAGLVALARRAGAVPRVALLAAALVLLTNASFVSNWRGGVCFGPRYTCAALPFLALGLPRGIELAGRSGRWIVAASLLLSWIGASSDGFLDVPACLERFLLRGPIAAGPCMAVLGPLGNWSALPPLVVSVAVLSVAFRLAAHLGIDAKGRALAAWAALPVVAAVPAIVLFFALGPATTKALYVEAEHAATRRAIAGCFEVSQVRYVAWIAGPDPDLALDALEKQLELDPADVRTREAVAALRARLGR